MKIKRTLSVLGFITDYEITCNVGKREGETTWFETTSYKTENGEFSDEDWTKIRYDMDDFYEKFKNRIKQSGIITGVGLLLITLITGLALCLKKAGNDIVVVKPSKKKKTLIPVRREQPWKKIENTAKRRTGGGLIFIGDYIFLITRSILLYLGPKK